MTSRRTFLKQASAAAALGIFPDFPLQQLLATPLRDLLPEEDDVLLRELALKAVDAARAAGASFADVRLTVGRSARFELRSARILARAAIWTAVE